MIEQGKSVYHAVWGQGKLLCYTNSLAVVHYSTINEIKTCHDSELQAIDSISDKLLDYSYDHSKALEFVTRFQAEAIESINNEWGLFSISKIDLLPHQLWVCKKVIEQIPCRWLIADDVGLGKTIEAGLILLPLLQKQRVDRLLIITPASLVTQWQSRMFEMFDIRLREYHSQDNRKGKFNFWQSNNQIIASLQTLRLDNNDLIDKICNSETFDLVIVDEAHHLNNTEHGSETLGYQLIKRLQEKDMIKSMLFFTGTPHRGKNYGFISLLSLLNPNLFNPRRPHLEQYEHLKKVMIRNNKQCVTDFNGDKLFGNTVVKDIEYNYTEYEKKLYQNIRDFILSGRTYASSHNNEKTINLVLTVFEKLLSSSFAAIKSAFKRRLDIVKNKKNTFEQLTFKANESKLLEIEDSIDFDDSSMSEENDIINHFIDIHSNEEEAILEILEQFQDNVIETKFVTILDLVKRELPERSILFFTEYKSTQAVLVSLLMKEFGEDTVTFINGDDQLSNFEYPNGKVDKLIINRTTAEQDFNSGKKRYLVSTEAAGEGKDLQNKCHTLIHVDMHWNPMRMHQRVGRINRYGQTELVEVYYILNKENADMKIRDFMDSKINNIMEAFNSVMEDKEDLKQIILGSASNYSIEQLALKIKNNEEIREESIKETFATDDIFNIVQNMIGNVEKFDFNNISNIMPKLNLTDLFSFTQNASEYYKIRFTPSQNEDKIELKVPKEFRSLAIKSDYVITFNRKTELEKVDIMGVGNKLFNKILDETRKHTQNICILQNNPQKLLGIYRVYETLSRDNLTYAYKLIGIEVSEDDEYNILTDAVLLNKLNTLQIPKILSAVKRTEANIVEETINTFTANINQYIVMNSNLFAFNNPMVELMGLLYY